MLLSLCVLLSISPNRQKREKPGMMHCDTEPEHRAFRLFIFRSLSGRIFCTQTVAVLNVSVCWCCCFNKECEQGTRYGYLAIFCIINCLWPAALDQTLASFSHLSLLRKENQLDNNVLIYFIAVVVSESFCISVFW